jgi:UDP:flavonoid glycosyltransferase YjiC (YdhE family)
MVGRGHNVTIVSQPSVRDRALASGCSFIAFDCVGDYERGKTIEEQLDVVVPVITGAEIGEQLLAVAREQRVDAIVLDCNLGGAAAAVETLGTPSALLLHSMFVTFTDVWFAEIWPLVGPIINDTRLRFGLDAAGSWTAVFAGHDRLISVVPASFDIPVISVPNSMRHFGFLVPAAAPAHVERVLPEGDAPTVLVGLSTTYQHQEALLQRILDAVAARTLRVLVTTGAHVDPESLRVPDNAAVAGHVDHALVLNNVDVLVTHGGLGTVAAGLGHGVPLVCVPLGRDQHVNAKRVAELGAGIALAPDATAHEIGAAIDQVLSDDGYRRGAAAIASASRAAGGAPAAVDDLESLRRSS